MKFVIIFTTLLLSLVQSKAMAYQYFYFDQSKISLSRSSFTRYVLPQLRSINQEFYSVLKKVEPLTQEVIQIKKSVSSMKRSWKVGKAQCESPELCEKLLSSLRKNALDLEKKISLFQKNKLTGKEVKSRHIISRLLSVSEYIDSLSLKNYRLIHKLENRIIDGIDKDAVRHEKFDKISITNLLKEMAFHAEYIMLGLVNEKFNSLFQELWSSFMNPIEDYILTKGNQDYLEKNLGDLNLGWSSFHMHMERGNLNVPNNILVTITIMRQRWNSILKMYLKNTEFLDGEDS